MKKDQALMKAGSASDRSPRDAARSALLLLLVGSVGAEAALIRGGGRGSSSVVTDVSVAGTVPFLVPDPDPAPDTDENNAQFVGGAVPTLSNSVDAQTAAYGFGPLGRPLSIEHAYGRECSRDIECSFALDKDETLSWQAVLLGLPDEMLPVDYLALAGIEITWEFRAVEEPPPGTFTTFPSSRAVPELSWTRSFAPDSTGGYVQGSGSAAVTLGASLGYNPASDDLSGCFGLQAPAPDSTLSLQEFYSFGSCRLVELDLGLADPAGLTGADLLDIAGLATNEFLSLFVTAELTAPNGFQFANMYLEGGDLGVPATLTGAVVPTPTSILASLDEDPSPLRYRGCAAFPDTGCGVVVSNSQGLRVDVVPTPTPLMLLLGGLIGLCAQRRLRRRVEVRRPS